MARIALRTDAGARRQQLGGGTMTDGQIGALLYALAWVAAIVLATALVVAFG